MLKRFKVDTIEVAMNITHSTDPTQLYWAAGRLDDLSMLKVFKSVQKKGVAVDIGASWGNHSVYFGKIAERRVYAFEPNKTRFEVLKKNAISNELDAKIYNYAISDYAGFAHRNKEGIQYIKSAKDILTIRTNILNAFIFEPVAFIRVNVENHYSEILSGSKRILKESQPDLFIKVHKNRINDVLDLLNNRLKLKYEHVEHLEIGYVHDLKHFRAV
jgi:FkbM family methyltransferase